MSKRINNRGDEEFEYISIKVINGKYEERWFWSSLRFPSKPTSCYVRASDPENIEAHRARARRTLQDQQNETFLQSLIPSEPVIEPVPTAPSNVVTMQPRKTGRVFQRYATR